MMDAGIWGWVVAVGMAAAWWLERWRRRRVEAWLREKDAQRARVIKGQVAEQLAPWIPEFPFHPRDARFLGNPVDYVVFDGMSEGKLRRIVLVEIKTGRSRRSALQRDIEEAVRRKRVDFVLLRLP